MTIWMPELRGRAGPKYQAIVDAIVDALETGDLKPGTKLPPQRNLAYDLGVTLGTVTRAYQELERSGLARGEVGRGTFITAPADRAVTRVNHEAVWEAVSRYQSHNGLRPHRDAGALWLNSLGVDAKAEDILIAPGAQAATQTALMALARPGDLILAEALSWPGLKATAAPLGLRVEGLAMDEHGLIPDAFEQACRDRAPRLLYLLPTLQNPTTSVMPEDRRRQVAEIARRHGVFVIEDDVYGFLLDDAPPSLHTIAADVTVYVTSLSKAVSPGLRVGYVVVPQGRMASFVGALRSSTLMASPLTVEIASEMIRGGEADEMMAHQRREVGCRQKQMVDHLGHLGLRTHPRSLHAWLPVPAGFTGPEFRTRLLERGVSVTPGNAFVMDERHRPDRPHVRICLGAEQDSQRLERALAIRGGGRDQPHGRTDLRLTNQLVFRIKRLDREPVVQGPMPPAQARGGADRRHHIGMSTGDGVDQVQPLGDPGRTGTGQGTPRAMSMGGIEARMLPAHAVRAGDQKVRHCVAVQMPALHQHGLGTQRQNVLARVHHVFDRAHGQARERFRLGQVGRDQGRTRQQPGLDGTNGIIVQKRMTALGDHHRIQNDRDVGRGFGQGIGDGHNNLGPMQHADLDTVGAQVFHHRADLLGDEISRHGLDPRDAQGVLGGQRGDRGHGVAAQRRHGLDVGLNARAAAGIRTGNNQDTALGLHGIRSELPFPGQRSAHPPPG